MFRKKTDLLIDAGLQSSRLLAQHFCMYIFFGWFRDSRYKFVVCFPTLGFLTGEFFQMLPCHSTSLLVFPLSIIGGTETVFEGQTFFSTFRIAENDKPFFDALFEHG